MAHPVLMYIIPINLVVNVVVIICSIHMELVQIAPLPQSLEEDIDMTDVLNNMIKLRRAW